MRTNIILLATFFMIPLTYKEATKKLFFKKKIKINFSIKRKFEYKENHIYKNWSVIIILG